MQAEIIAIGTELLLGVTVDTNSAYLARELGTIGVPVNRVTLVGDDLEAMVTVIQQAHGRSELVICSGGLGPTGDDLTREAIGRALDRPLQFHQELLDEIAARFATFNRTMSSSNRQQAYVPQDAYIIHNPRGTAPAFVAERDAHLVAALPGVPSELKWLTEHALVPYLREQHGANTVRVVREVHISGMTEAAAGELIAEFFNRPNPVVGITAKGGQHTIRIAATAPTTAAAEELIAPLTTTIRDRFGKHVLEDEKLEARVGRLLATNGVTLFLHETLVEAPIYRLLTTVAGGSAALGRGGMVLRPLGTVDQTTVETAARELIDPAIAAHGPVFAIAAAAEPHEGEGMTIVHIAASDGRTTVHTARGYDLHISSGFEILAASALEMLRRWFERMG